MLQYLTVSIGNGPRESERGVKFYPFHPPWLRYCRLCEYFGVDGFGMVLLDSHNLLRKIEFGSVEGRR